MSRLLDRDILTCRSCRRVIFVLREHYVKCLRGQTGKEKKVVGGILRSFKSRLCQVVLRKQYCFEAGEANTNARNSFDVCWRSYLLSGYLSLCGRMPLVELSVDVRCNSTEERVLTVGGAVGFSDEDQENVVP